MIICLALKNGNSYLTNAESIEDAKKRVNLGEPIDCWWYSYEGKKFKETFLFPDDGDAVSYYRTESDASPLEEM